MVKMTLRVEPFGTSTQGRLHWNWRMTRTAGGKTHTADFERRKDAVDAITEQIRGGYTAGYDAIDATLLDPTGAGERRVYHADGRMEVFVIAPKKNAGIGPRCSTLPTTDEEKAARRKALAPPKRDAKAKAAKPAKAVKTKPAKAAKPAKAPKPAKVKAPKPAKVPKPAKPAKAPKAPKAKKAPAHSPSIAAYLAASMDGESITEASKYLASLSVGKRIALSRVTGRGLTEPQQTIFEAALKHVSTPAAPSAREERKKGGAKFKRGAGKAPAQTRGYGNRKPKAAEVAAPKAPKAPRPKKEKPVATAPTPEPTPQHAPTPEPTPAPEPTPPPAPSGDMPDWMKAALAQM